MTESKDDYEWPNKYATADKKHLEALGIISLNFNLYEFSLIIFFDEYFDKEVAGFLFHKLNNEERAAIIRVLMKTDPEPALTDEIEFLLRHFSTCAENRHNLLHARLIMPMNGILALEKMAKGTSNKILEFQLKIGDLRRAADEMHAGFNFVLELWRYFRDRNKYHSQVELAEEGLIQAPPLSELPSLPKRPPAPHKISPHQSVEVS